MNDIKEYRRKIYDIVGDLIVNIHDFFEYEAYDDPVFTDEESKVVVEYLTEVQEILERAQSRLVKLI